jgi:uncharacterized membrane protein YoaK (UPF0700 family)
VLLLLTFTTGIVDAVSFLGLGQVFTANMTGNVIFLGFGLAGGFGLPVLTPLVSLGSFILGAGAGGLLASRTYENHALHVGIALGLESGLLGVAALIAALVDIRIGHISAGVVIAVIAFAMGIRNATVRKIAVPDMTTTVVTMTITGLASDLRAVGGPGDEAKRRVAVVAAIILGALIGALMLKTSIVLPLAAASVLTAVAVATYVPTARRRR